ncbi:sugar phosphate isomerase/epimerase family protein [Levilactobacillus bambusae]|uniref:Sugar phosphate isomerase n=1 Tax=Levilactobacillus bambusae TaxID=2024736 RepID=A0A2V1MYT4_9LACO|nr:TIM barrel protein [Levilactobacillus bambusae]PWG00171.1 sugar phosphate isomerase [Levilactobacillus bambusae]
MKKDQIVLNTLVYAEQHRAGVSQADMLSDVNDAEIKTAEVRREFFSDFESDLDQTAKAAQQFGITLYYSVPESLFLNGGQVNPDLMTYFDEGKRLGIKKIKFNTGDFAHYQGNLATDFAPFLETGIEINVENDQTQLSGTFEHLVPFLTAAKEANVDIKNVYDLGNWRFVSEDELEAAKQVAPFVRYIHVKDDYENDSGMAVVPLGDGIIDWKAALNLLPTDVPVALEYPATDEQIDAGIKDLEEFTPEV